MILVTLIFLASLVRAQETPLPTDRLCIFNNVSVCGYDTCTTGTPTTTCPAYVYQGGCAAANVVIKYVDVPVPGNTYPNCTLSGFPSDMCQQNCLMSTPSIGCGGTTAYCNKYNCSASYTCYCNLFNMTTTPYIEVGGVNMLFNLTWYPCTTKSYNVLVQEGLVKRALTATNVFVTFDDPNIFVQNPDGHQLNIIITKDDYRALYTTDQSFIGYPIPSQNLVASGTIYVDVYKDSELLVSYSTFFTGSTMCRLKSCIVCWDAIENYRCLPTVYKVIVVVILVFLAAIALVFIPPLLYGIMMLIKCFFVPTWWLMKTSANAWRKKVRPMERINGAYKRMDAVNDVESAPQVPKGRGSRPQARFALTLLTICSLVCSSSAICIASGTVASMLTNCVVGGASCPSGTGNLCKSCDVALSIQSVVPVVGGSACYQIKDQNNTLRGTLEVRYNYLLERVSLAKMYYTSNFFTLSQSSKKCYDPSGQNSVCKNNMCSTLSGDRTAYGTLTIPDVVSRPGRAQCTAGCGCAGCGCFFCQSSCLYSGYGIIPYGTVYEVDSFSTVTFVPSVTFNMTDEFGVSTVITTEIVGVSIALQNVTFLTLGTYQSSVQLFGSKSVVWNTSTDAWLTYAAPAGAPNAGDMGDIQGNTYASLSTISPNAFIFDTDIMIPIVQQEGVTYTQTTPGASKLVQTGTKFPLVAGGAMWSYSTGFLTGNITSPGAVSTQITISGNRKLSISTAAVCPSFTVVTASGCYSCVTGSVIVISAKSTCYAGAVAVTTTDPSIIVNSPAIILTTEFTNFSIYINTGIASNSFNLTLIAATNATQAVVFTAVQEQTIGNNTSNNTDTNTTSSGWFDSAESFFINLGSTIANFFEDVFTGVARWWEYLIMVIIISGVLIVTALVANVVYKAMKARGYMKMKNK